MKFFLVPPEIWLTASAFDQTFGARKYWGDQEKPVEVVIRSTETTSSKSPSPSSRSIQAARVTSSQPAPGSIGDGGQAAGEGGRRVAGDGGPARRSRAGSQRSDVERAEDGVRDAGWVAGRHDGLGLLFERFLVDPPRVVPRDDHARSVLAY